MDITYGEIAAAEQTPAVVGFDIETASAEAMWNGEHEGPFARLFGWTDEFFSGVAADPARMLEELRTADVIYGHNIFRFDLPALARHCGADYDALAAKAVDTAVLARLSDPPMAKHGTPAGYYSLDEVAHRLGHEGKTDNLKALAEEHGGYDRIPVDDGRYERYLHGDLAASAYVYDRLTESGISLYARREMKVAALQNRMVLNGWLMDVPLLRERVAQEDATRDRAVQILGERYGVPLVKADGKPSASPWATKGGRKALEKAFGDAGAVFVPRTGTGALALGKDALGDGTWVDHQKKMRPGMLHQRAYGHLPAVRELCETVLTATGATRKYAELIKYVTPEGRVHAGIGEDQASGRWAQTRPSTTNLGKRGPALEQRRPFIAERKHVVMAFDMDQVDMRAIAGHCQDPAYMRMFEPGRDAHSEIAQMVFGRSDGSWRERSKRCGHGWNYGMSVNGLVNSGVERSVAEHFDQQMNARFPDLCAWRQDVRDRGAAGLFLDNGFGRMMRCDPARAWTQAPALVGQGGARDLMCEGLLRLDAKAPETRPMLRGVVHDEVVMVIPEQWWREYAELIRGCLTFEWRGVAITAGASKPGRSWVDCYAK